MVSLYSSYDFNKLIPGFDSVAYKDNTGFPANCLGLESLQIKKADYYAGWMSHEGMLRYIFITASFQERHTQAGVKAEMGCYALLRYSHQTGTTD